MAQDVDKLREVLREKALPPMSERARERQIVSLAYGNLKIEHDRVTRAAVADTREPKPKKP